jgi:hypothetical protein
MFRIAILATALAAGAAAAFPAQPYPGYTPQPAPAAADLDGQWFMSGDPFQPTYIQSFRDPFGTYLVLTNERGERSLGRLLPGGRIIADGWGQLVGDVRGNRILWRNGSDWIR